jgi:hypothetical protein
MLINPAVKLVIIVLVIILIFVINWFIMHRDMKYVKSSIDNKYYLVRDVEDSHKASNMLAKIKSNIFSLVKYVKKNRSKYQKMSKYIDLLDKGIENVIIRESSPHSKYTSYCVNKGEEIVFCLRARDDKGNLHDMNLIMYIVIHEISHVACPENNHTPLYNRIFKFLCKMGVDLGIYKKIDFNKKPLIYCGMKIANSII